MEQLNNGLKQAVSPIRKKKKKKKKKTHKCIFVVQPLTQSEIDLKSDQFNYRVFAGVFLQL